MHTTTTHEKAHGCNPAGFQNDTTNGVDFPRQRMKVKPLQRWQHALHWLATP